MKLGICGLGLIGSSVARAVLANSGPVTGVLGLDPDPLASTRAAELGVEMVPSLGRMAECDLILLAAPTAVNVVLLDRLMTTGMRVPTADLGSVKVPIVRTWKVDRSFPFVATHPMAGSEGSGVEAGTASLFDTSVWAVVVESATDADALEVVVGLILRLGARVLPVSASAHDEAVARISHLPHLLAGALGDVVAEDHRRDLAIRLAAGSFRDGTRVNASPPGRTSEFIVSNAVHSAAAARAAAAQLQKAADAIDSGDSSRLADWLGPAHRLRHRWADQGHEPERTVEVGSAEQLRDLLFRGRDSDLVLVGRSGGTVTVQGDPA